MRTRLAMLACKGPHTTPWMAPQGGESAVRVLHLVEGEVVLVEEDGGTLIQVSSPGEYPFQPASRFRFQKVREEETLPSPTLVEVLYNV